MSQRRNTAGAPSRSRYTLAAAGAVAALAACSADRVAAPAAAPSAALAPAPLPPLPKDAGKRLTDLQLDAAAQTFRTTSTDVEAPTTQPLPLACGVRGQYMVSQRIGKGGGSLRFGRSELKVPSGALAADVQISATITLGQGVNVVFAPHGLKFAKPVELRVDYTGCTVPSGQSVNVYYTDSQNRITQVMPSATKTGAPVTRAVTDHFSGYAISWGRGSYSAY